MCTRARCSQCGKATWRGCGAHIEQVLRGVGPQDRCSCAQHSPEGLFASLKRLLTGGS